jgi:hypothetical protein
MHPRSPLPLFGILLFGCVGTQGDDSTKQDQESAPGQERPEIELRPVEVNFGTIAVGSSAELMVTVANQGEAALEIFSVDLQGGSSDFDVSAIGSVLIPPDQGTTFTVTFTPQNPVEAADAVVIESSDPDQKTSFLPLYGLGS